MCEEFFFATKLKVVCHKKQNLADANIFEENLKHIKILWQILTQI